MIRARVIGACGFGGGNIIELLSAHPEVEIASLVDVQGVGEPVSAQHTHLRGFCDIPIEAPDEAKGDDSVDVAFTATPDGVGMKLAPDAIASGAKLVDYSGDFRFQSAEAYADYATRLGMEPKHLAADLLSKTVYGLAELHRDEIAKSSIVGNPGCFAVSSILGLAPAVKNGLVDTATLICDAKTGISGAGIKPHATFHYPVRYENMNAYKIAAHQHNMEIEHETSLLAGKPLTVTLTTQVLPLSRGIMTTVYGKLLDDGATAETLYEAYKESYVGSKFVRIEPSGVPTSNNDVRGSNFCVLSINVDPRTRQMIVVSHIDNLMKGQAGSALQNMNIMFGLDETTGLMRPPFYP